MFYPTFTKVSFTSKLLSVWHTLTRPSNRLTPKEDTEGQQSKPRVVDVSSFGAVFYGFKFHAIMGFRGELGFMVFLFAQGMYNISGANRILGIRV